MTYHYRYRFFLCSTFFETDFRSVSSSLSYLLLSSLFFNVAVVLIVVINEMSFIPISIGNRMTCSGIWQ